MNISLNSIIDSNVCLSEGEYNILWHFLSIPLKVWKGEIPHNPEVYGVYNGDTIQISLQNIKESFEYKTNRLTVEGVIIHEF